MKTIQAIYVICCLSLIFAIFSIINKQIKLSKVKWLKENTCKISMAKKPPPKLSGRLLILSANLNTLLMTLYSPISVWSPVGM